MSKKKKQPCIIKNEDFDYNVKLIVGSIDYYVSDSGDIFKKEKKGWLKKKLFTNKHNGYVYCGVRIDGEYKSRRVHRLVAQAFIHNPNNKPVVNHINHKKDDNRVENLEWVTVAENTQDAYDNGLEKNDKGYDDSQSYPIWCINLNTGYIQDYGSISEASKILHISKSTIARQCKNKNLNFKPRCGYRFMYQ